MGDHFTDDYICHDKISDMKKSLICKMHECITNDGNFCSANTEEVGEIIDMIKDLAATERYQAQTCYYSAVTEAMSESDPYVMGYIPEYADYDSMRRMKDRNRNLVDFRGRKVPWNPMESSYDDGPRSRHTSYFDDWKMDKKYYTETHDEDHKNRMNVDADRHISIKEIWDEADPDLRSQMKSKLKALVDSMSA